VVAQDAQRASGPVMLALIASLGRGGEALPQQLATPIPLLVVLGVIAAAATAGMDRLVLRLGPEVPPR
jgi:hypothetical protein